MRATLFPFQENALAALHERISRAHRFWKETEPQVITFSAPTGSGKTIIMTALFEEILFGHADGLSQPDAVIIWLSDSPELNEQTKMKIESKSDKILVRQMVTIDSSFDAEHLKGGCIYFLNTQKLGSDKLLVSEGDKRQYSIWTTLANTAKRNPLRIYVVIDEAHRGTQRSAIAEERAQSIIQKFIKGSPDDGLCIMPLIIGITATPLRFDTLIVGTDSTHHRVQVPAEHVRESGLLKDRIIIHYPDHTLGADMTLFKAAVDDWLHKSKRWQVYSEKENSKHIKPILVVQVEDSSGNDVTRTDIDMCIDILESSLGRKLLPGEAVHTFNDQGYLTFRNTEVRAIEPSRIEENEKARVVFFKMNLSTGWDCPRAETMMSFRNAQDYTYIAQLLGRMVRTPLARRIASDAELNNVRLFLPHFDEVTVEHVIDALHDREAVLPAETGSHTELITLGRNPEYTAVFTAMQDLVTYRIDTTRKVQPLRLMIQLARTLTLDGIDVRAQSDTKSMVLDLMQKEISKLKQERKYDQLASEFTRVELG